MPVGIILDTNLLVLLVVGATDRGYIGKHKRLAGYSEIDLDWIDKTVGRSAGLVLTPNVLTETSNLVRQVHEPIRTEASMMLGSFAGQFREVYIESRVAVRRHDYARLGLTDSVLLAAADRNCTIVTVDLALYLAAERAGLSVVNYNHVREARGDFL